MGASDPMGTSDPNRVGASDPSTGATGPLDSFSKKPDAGIAAEFLVLGIWQTSSRISCSWLLYGFGPIPVQSVSKQDDEASMGKNVPSAYASCRATQALEDCGPNMRCDFFCAAGAEWCLLQAADASVAALHGKAPSPKGQAKTCGLIGRWGNVAGLSKSKKPSQTHHFTKRALPNKTSNFGLLRASEQLSFLGAPPPKRGEV